ncbi:hypothetical protein FQR65_LT01863 [Abscondita terminalis]|nr:hypothetical protein FQR65_LT01863 [Abscondita terminalis]
MERASFKNTLIKDTKIQEEEINTKLLLYLRQFCTTTSIHGLKYLGERNRYTIEKFWWFTVLILASIGSSSLIYKSYMKWKTSPIVVTLAMTETPIWQIPFPAVTICPELKSNSKVFNYSNVYFKLSANETVTTDEEEDFQLLSLICEAEIRTKGVEYFENVQVDRLIGMLNSNDADYCKWAGKELDCSSVLEPIITSEGLCDTFNMLQLSEIMNSYITLFDDSTRKGFKGPQWSLQRSYGIKASLDVYPRRTALSGVKSGFQIDLFVDDRNLDYSCREIQGFKVRLTKTGIRAEIGGMVSLHHPSEIPDLVNYFRVPLDQVVVAAVKPNMITTSEDLINYDPLIRQCYLPGDIKLQAFKMYTQRNCILECLSKYLIKKCGCTMIHLPRENTTKICGPGKLECFEHYQAKLMERGVKYRSNVKISKFYCGCLPLCTSLSFDAETSQTGWNWRKTYGWMSKNSSRYLDTETGHYSRLIVFYKEMQFLTSERHEVYGFMEFCANCGGLFGLFLGFSFTSAMEILYFLTLRLFCNRHSKVRPRTLEDALAHALEFETAKQACHRDDTSFYFLRKFNKLTDTYGSVESCLWLLEQVYQCRRSVCCRRLFCPEDKANLVSMSWVYKHNDGTKHLKKYSEEVLEKCLSEVLNDKFSANKNFKKHNTPKGTLIDKVHLNKYGGQSVLTKIKKMGISFKHVDLRLNAQECREEFRFQRNFPAAIPKRNREGELNSIRRKKRNSKYDDSEATPFTEIHKRKSSDEDGNRCLNNTRNYFCEFCDNTSIHGFKFLGERERYVIEKVWWFCVILIALSLSGLLIMKSFDKWKTSPIVVTFATTETAIWEIPFPAITICPEVNAHPKVFNYTDVYLKYVNHVNTSEKEDLFFKLFSTICNEELEFIDENVTKIMSAENFEEFLGSFADLQADYCMWLGSKQDCNEVFDYILTSEGWCRTFNMLDQNEVYVNPGEFLDNSTKKSLSWSLEYGYPDDAGLHTYPRRVLLTGAKAGFQVDLFVNASNLDYLCGELQGFKVALHHPAEVPNMDTHFRVPLDQAVVAAIKPEMITTSEEIRAYDYKDRKCYLPGEKVLSSYKSYTQQNCLVECLTNYTLKECGCVGFYMLSEADDAVVCGAGSKKCLENVKVNFLEKDLSSSQNAKGGENVDLCRCLPSCTSINFDSEVSQTEWDWRKTFALKHSDQVNINNQEFHLSRLLVYYKNLQFMTSERHELYGVVDFLANCGGLFGLFCGLSFTSITEIIYYLTLRLWCNFLIFGRRVWSGNSKMVEKDKKRKGEIELE